MTTKKTDVARILKTGTCLSLSGRSELTYEFGYIDKTILFRVVGNTGSRHYSSAWIHSGGEAVAKWEKGKFDLILMDLQMPEVNGIEATRAIRERENGAGKRICIVGLIRRYTRRQVFKVEDGMEAQINCVYIIPPNCDMTILNGTLQLLEPAAPRYQHPPIDFFFRSLAKNQLERAGASSLR